MKKRYLMKSIWYGRGRGVVFRRAESSSHPRTDDIMQGIMSCIYHPWPCEGFVCQVSPVIRQNRDLVSLCHLRYSSRLTLLDDLMQRIIMSCLYNPWPCEGFVCQVSPVIRQNRDLVSLCHLRYSSRLPYKQFQNQLKFEYAAPCILVTSQI